MGALGEGSSVLEGGKAMTMFERFQELLERLTELESGRRETIADVLGFHHRLRAIEARLPPPAIPVVTPVTFSQEQQAPVPDYRSDLPAEVEACSCDEAVELRLQLAEARQKLASLDAIAIRKESHG
jgi:hypothetical protein